MIRLLNFLIEKPMLYRRKRQRSGHHALISSRPLFGSDHCCQLGYRLVLKEMPWGDQQPGLIGFGYNLNTENRIAP